MKTRNGFVSNSSSSSFLIAWKKNKDKEKELQKILALPAKHPLEGISLEIANVISDCIEERFTTEEEYDAYLEESGDSREKKIIELLKDKYEVGIGSFTNEESGIEGYLCDNDIEINTDKIVFLHEGGY
jgi:hypothetical protein